MNISDHLPHASKIIMIDEVVEFGAGKIKTRSVIKEDNGFLRDGKIEMYKAIEIMAQALGVYDSKTREESGKKSGLGFLLGSRKFEIFIPCLSVGDEVEVVSICSIQDDSGFGVYDCELYVNGILGSKASLSVISPDDDFLQKVLND
ncbi:ApeP family dehydratase [Campylobacter sp. RM16192]|uniref:ApeP family dehydratase n=1 Tax=Campylobacter sp. RM16192 TaxID=1660080 RepID=UPI001451B4EE|nr:thioester dehydrase [Campylobacter sp. RM16192]QCD52732.1 putative 3-hydroxylacyl-[acp] dehydratase [Campylobacter sp. RM16192]